MHFVRLVTVDMSTTPLLSGELWPRNKICMEKHKGMSTFAVEVSGNWSIYCPPLNERWSRKTKNVE
jgi:hypothetical protein